MNLSIATPRAFMPLLAPARYKGAHGGRGSGKSHFFAESLVERCLIHPGTRWACIREVQKSLEQSVKRLLEDKIEALGVGDMFRVKQFDIETPGGGIIIFQGMQNHTADSIKSLEGFDGAWVEEAQSLSQRSLDLLRPTIRKEGSELWFSWNPSQETDPVDALLRGDKPPPGSVVVTANYMDNPWLPEVLRVEMEYDRSRDPDKYAHVWLGEYQRNSEARVFKNWTVEEFEAPKGATFRLGADWGFATDPSVLVRCYLDGRRLMIDYEAYMVGCEIDRLPDLFRRVPESEKWFITADSARPETISYMQRHGFPKINAAIKGPKSLEEGVEFLKSYDIVVHPRCQHVIDELTLYSYKIDPLTSQVLPALADKDNHCIAEGVRVTCLRGDVPIENVTTDDMVLTRGGWRRVLFAGQTDSDRETMLVETTAGAVRCTPDHEIWTARGFVRADALRYDDEIINVEQVSWSSALLGMVVSTAAILRAGMQQAATTFSAAFQAALRYCIGTSGSITTVLSLMASRSTTLTAILETTPLRIWRCCRAQSTAHSMDGATSARQASASIWSASGPSQKIGMPAQKALPSIVRLEGCHTPHSNLSASPVLTVEACSNRERLEVLICTAAIPANPLRGALLALTTKLARARSAARLFLQTNIQRSRLVAGRVVALSAAEPCERVYDLTIDEHHEFFANGVLVSNCIDAVRYALEGVRRAAPRRERKQTVYSPGGWMG